MSLSLWAVPQHPLTEAAPRMGCCGDRGGAQGSRGRPLRFSSSTCPLGGWNDLQDSSWCPYLTPSWSFPACRMDRQQLHAGTGHSSKEECRLMDSVWAQWCCLQEEPSGGNARLHLHLHHHARLHLHLHHHLLAWSALPYLSLAMHHSNCHHYNDCTIQDEDHSIIMIRMLIVAHFRTMIIIVYDYFSIFMIQWGKRKLEAPAEKWNFQGAMTIPKSG